MSSPPTRSTSQAPSTQRARPVLGTLVSIRIDGLPRDEANEAIDRAFAEVERVHRLMSFHEPGSDVSRLNREALLRPVPVDPFTYEVLRCALVVAEASGGVFDPCVARQLVAWGILPAPRDAPPADAAASWRDIELGPDGTLRFHRPLWIDLGGIAKGFAVDRAIEALAAARAPQCVVNAGGDLRVAGAAPERVVLDAERARDADLPVLELRDASVASSSGVRDRRRHDGRAVGPHVHGRSGVVTGARSFVSVVASTCMIADALTKVVLARRSRAAPLLQRFGAVAYWHNARLGWREIPREPRAIGEHP